MATQPPVRRTRGGAVETAHEVTTGAAQSFGAALPTLPTAPVVTRSAPQPTRGSAAPVRQMRGAPVADAPMGSPPQSTTTETPVPSPNAPPAPLRGSRLDDLLPVMVDLCGVLARENEALANRIPEQIEAELERKQYLGRLYHDYMLSIRRNPRQLDPLPEETRAALKKAATILDALSAENNRLLKVHISVVDSLLTTVVNAVRDQALTSKVYSGSGHLDPMTTEARLLAVSMNQEF